MSNRIAYFNIILKFAQRKKMSSITFTIIKPEILTRQLEGEVVGSIIKGGFKIIALKKTKFSEEQAKRFYAIHSERPFFQGLVKYITSGPVYVAVLEKENAVNDFRLLIGATNPEQAEKNTIRAKYGTNIEQNAIHGSDSDENAIIEGNFFFSHFERY